MTNTQKQAILIYLDDLAFKGIRLKCNRMYDKNVPACIAGHVAMDLLHKFPWENYLPATEILIQAFGISRGEAAGIVRANNKGWIPPEDSIRNYLKLCSVEEGK